MLLYNVIVQLLNSTRSSAIADKAPNASCQNYIHNIYTTATYTDRFKDTSP